MRRVLTISAIAGTVVALCAPGASAAPASGWQPVRTPPFVRTGTCPFPVAGASVTDEEEARVDAVLPDGSPRVEEFRGPLTMRFTNQATGRSVVRDLSGYGRIRFSADGASTGFFPDNVGLHVPVGTPGHAPGEFVVHGGARMTIAADGTREIRTFPHATIEDLCRTLAR
ncbi:MAG TPA: hypothetical protein VGL93_10105 [Streptosporangiaceae bacterium]|jgi:hypothetical protein